MEMEKEEDAQGKEKEALSEEESQVINFTVSYSNN